MRNRNSQNKDQFYLIEVFTEPEIDSEKMRTYIIDKTGMNPTILDNGTHYAFNDKLTFEFLKELSDLKDVLAIYGDFMGGVTGVGASHEHTEHEHGWIK